MKHHGEVWKKAHAQLAFPFDRIDVWRVQLDQAEAAQQDFQGILARDELDRAARFHFEIDRLRYARSRCALRILLGRYLAVPPAEIRFDYRNNGKPEIAFPQPARPLRFNVSHSGGGGLIAIGSANELGVDVEAIRPMPNLLDIARRFFSASEIQGILKLTEHKKLEAFFACWTRKEAFLKATGVGLSYPLAGFSVSVDPDAPAELCDVKGEREEARDWFLADVFPWPGFRGAIACKGDRCAIALRVLDL